MAAPIIAMYTKEARAISSVQMDGIFMTKRVNTCQNIVTIMTISMPVMMISRALTMKSTSDLSNFSMQSFHLHHVWVKQTGRA
jgi:hypothetical protein